MTSQIEQRLKKLKMDAQVMAARGTSDRSIDRLSGDLQNLLVEGNRILQGISQRDEREEYTKMKNLVETIKKTYVFVSQEAVKIEAQLRALYQAL